MQLHACMRINMPCGPGAVTALAAPAPFNLKLFNACMHGRRVLISIEIKFKLHGPLKLKFELESLVVLETKKLDNVDVSAIHGKPVASS
jgi:hypothetical protein